MDRTTGSLTRWLWLGLVLFSAACGSAPKALEADGGSPLVQGSKANTGNANSSNANATNNPPQAGSAVGPGDAHGAGEVTSGSSGTTAKANDTATGGTSGDGPSGGSASANAVASGTGTTDGGAAHVVGLPDGGISGEPTGENPGGDSNDAGLSGADSCQPMACPDYWICDVRQDKYGCSHTCARADGLEDVFVVGPEFAEGAAGDVTKLGCNVLIGSLWLYGTSVKNAVGLESLREITGELKVDQSLPDSLQGLENLERVGSLKLLTSLKVIELPALKSVANEVNVFYQSEATELRLPALESAGTISIDRCDSIASISLDSLKTVETLEFIDNQELTTLNGLPALESVTRLQIASNPKLPECEVDGIAQRLGCERCELNGPAGSCE